MRYNHLATLTSGYDKPIHTNCQPIPRLEGQAQNIASYTNVLSFCPNIDQHEKLFVLKIVGKAFPELENAIHSFLRTNAIVIQNVGDAACGGYSPLAPVNVFLKILEIDIYN